MQSFALDKKTPIYILMGGYMSCPLVFNSNSRINKVTDLLQERVENIQESLDQESYNPPLYFTTCYTGPQLGASFSKSLSLDYFELNYSQSLQSTPDIVSNQSHKELIDDALFVDVTPLTKLWTVLKKEIQTVANPVVIIVGHSYGGWTAIQTANHLMENSIDVFGLMTLDAISPVHCHPSVLTDSVLQFKQTKGCTRFSEYLTSSQINRLQVNLNWWLHFYQDQSYFLHSDDISELNTGHSVKDVFPFTQSQLHVVDKEIFIDNEHRLFPYESELWSAFEELQLVRMN